MKLVFKLILIFSLLFTFLSCEIQKKEIKEYTNDIEIVFCPSKECLNIYSNSFKRAKNSIKCAFFEFSEENLIQTLNNLSIISEIITDDRYLEKLKDLKNSRIYSDKNRNTKYNNYVHDKFCIIDEFTLIVGSANPTYNGFNKNNNNILMINSKKLSRNFLNEFEQLKTSYGENKVSNLEFERVDLISNYTYNISSYFCPQDNCEKEIIKRLSNARKEIQFASFSFTSEGISYKLIQKSFENISIKGIIETRMANIRGSKYNELKEFIQIKLDRNKNTMHHKFFIIDEKITITGSMNPSNAGNLYNDENILIINSKEIAKIFKEEFHRLYNESNTSSRNMDANLG